MTKAGADPGLFDNLWYFDSVVRKTPPIKRGKSSAKHSVAVAAASGPAADDDIANECESQLPLSTGGEQGAPIYPASCGCGNEGAEESGCESCMKSTNDRDRGRYCPSMCELVEKMEKGTGELSAKELSLWMQKLGLEYTADGAMIRRSQPASAHDRDLISQQKLMDFSEFVCINRFIEEERHMIDDPHYHSHPQQADDSSSFDSDAHMASLYEIFHLFDRDDNGLISPSELRAALAKLGLCRNGSGR